MKREERRPFDGGRVRVCMFERAWSLMGMENVLMSMLICPDELDELFDRICDYYLPMIDFGLLEYDVDAVYFGDDWGQQRGLIMGPNHWRHFLKPRMARLYRAGESRGEVCHSAFLRRLPRNISGPDRNRPGLLSNLSAGNL